MNIQESQRSLVIIDYCSWAFFSNDLAKYTGWLGIASITYL